MRRVIGVLTVLAFAGLSQTAVAQSPETTPALTSVSCPSTSWCVAVGSYVNQSTDARSGALVESWNGKRWALQTTPTPVGGVLDGVSCTSQDACTAVGEAGSFSGGNAVPLVERWNGSQWVIQSTPSLGRQGSLDAVSCSSQNACTAAGTSMSGLSFPVIAEGWNGNQWVVEPTQFPAGQNLGFPSAVSCASEGVCMMVGIDEQDSASAIAGIWNGTDWQIQTLLTPSSTYKDSPVYLNGVSCESSGGCVAVGEYQPEANGQTIVALRWNGATGSVVSLPSPTEEYPRAVSCASASSCTAVGDQLDTQAPANQPIAEQFNGSDWVNHATPPLRGAYLDAVSCTAANACTAVGHTADGELLERWNGAGWVIQPTPAFNQGFNAGFNPGFNTSFKPGFQRGFEAGYRRSGRSSGSGKPQPIATTSAATAQAASEEATFNQGFDTGFDVGFHKGFNVGFNRGFDAAWRVRHR